MMRDAEDPTKLPGVEINWNDFVVDAVPEEFDSEDDLPSAYYLWDTDTNFDMFRLTPQELSAL